MVIFYFYYYYCFTCWLSLSIFFSSIKNHHHTFSRWQLIYHTFDFNPEILFHSFIHSYIALHCLYCHRITMHFFRLLFIVYENWIIIIDKKVTIIDQFIIDPNWIIYMVFIFFFFSLCRCNGGYYIWTTTATSYSISFHEMMILTTTTHKSYISYQNELMVQSCFFYAMSILNVE